MQNFMVKWWFGEVFNIFKSPGSLNPPPMNLSGPRGPWQIGLSKNIQYEYTWYSFLLKGVVSPSYLEQLRAARLFCAPFHFIHWLTISFHSLTHHFEINRLLLLLLFHYIPYIRVLLFFSVPHFHFCCQMFQSFSLLLTTSHDCTIVLVQRLKRLWEWQLLSMSQYIFIFAQFRSYSWSCKYHKEIRIAISN